jgi:hypothetical protein
LLPFQESESFFEDGDEMRKLKEQHGSSRIFTLIMFFLVFTILENKEENSWN